MRPDVVQQLNFDNATDWAAAVGVPLLPLVYAGIVVLTGQQRVLHEAGVPFSAVRDTLFCCITALCCVFVTLLAAEAMRGHAGRVLRRNGVQLKQMLQEHAAPDACWLFVRFPPGPIVLDATEQAASETEQPVAGTDGSADAASAAMEVAKGIRDLGMRFGQWCQLLHEASAPLEFRIVKVIFSTLLIPSWLIAIVMSNVPSMAPTAMLLVTISGYMSFNMGYRIGVRWALRANLKLLGVPPPSQQ
jgi:hypothetical protein